MPKTIFDIVTAQHIAELWTEVGYADTGMTIPLFPAAKQLGLDLKWIKGANGVPVVMKASAFDAHAIPRARIGFSELKAQMPYFKESTYVDEELRQNLNNVIASGNQALIDVITRRIFNDDFRLLLSASARREQMRCMLLTTGVIAMISNGQNYEFDYQVKHKANSATAWSDFANSDPIEDIRIAKEAIARDTGEVLTRAMCDGISWKNLRNNARIKNALAPVSLAVGNISSLSDNALSRFILDEVGITVEVNLNHYKDEDGVSYPYVPDNTFVLFPSGALGNTWFGTTPAESDLMSSGIANVSVVDVGVAITTAERVDPVQVETIVSQICLPSLEKADSLYILDTAGPETPPGP